MNWNGTDGPNIEDLRVLEEDWADEDGDNEADDETYDPEVEEIIDDLDAAIYTDEEGNIPTTEDLLQQPGLESLWMEAEDMEDQEPDSGHEIEVHGPNMYGNPEQTGEEVASEPPGPSTLGKRKRESQNIAPTESRKRLRKPASPPTGLSSFQSVRLKPLITRISVQQAIDQYGTPDLLRELQQHPHVASLTNSPDEHTLIDIWPYIRVQPPPRPHAPSAGLQRVCVQPPNANTMSSLASSDSVMYLNGPGAPSDTTRVHDCSVGQLTLLFRLSPSVFNPNPPLLAYVHRFTRIPQQPDAETGMYLVKKDRRTNGRLFGRVIEARQIVRVCPLAPVIREAANRQITPKTSFAFYEAFYINKYHSHEIFEYLHVL